MATGEEARDAPTAQQSKPTNGWWKRLTGTNAPETPTIATSQSPYRPKATLGILSDKQTDEVPGMLQLEEGALVYGVISLTSDVRNCSSALFEPQRASRSEPSTAS